MKPCFINKKDEVFGDQNTFRIWRRWGHLKGMQNFFDVQGGMFHKEDPVQRVVWSLDSWNGEMHGPDERVGDYERMIRIDFAESESVIIDFLLDELDGI